MNSLMTLVLELHGFLEECFKKKYQQLDKIYIVPKNNVIFILSTWNIINKKEDTICIVY
jgi:hypothetical protein